MASTTRRSDEERIKKPAAQADQTDGEPSDKDLPDDGGTESDRGALVKQDRNFDAGPAPTTRK